MGENGKTRERSSPFGYFYLMAVTKIASGVKCSLKKSKGRIID
jgi:hypothetical protein